MPITTEHIKPNVFIILGGGVLNSQELPAWVDARLEQLNQMCTQDDIIIFSSRYSLNIPPKLTKSGFIVCEAKLMYDVFTARFKKGCDFFLETASTDTIGSAFYCRLLFDSIMKDRNIKVITSDFHVQRAKVIFNHLFSAIPKIEFKSLDFIGALSEEMSQSRSIRELKSIDVFSIEYDKFITFDKIKEHLLKNHHNYNTEYKSSINDDEKLIFY